LCSAHSAPNSDPVREEGSIPDLFSGPSNPDATRYSARQPVEEIERMKNLILAAFAALSLTAAIGPAAHAFTTGMPHSTYHSGPYDNTGKGPGETGMEGGGG
jgi:hypothetical protein